ncbi:General transcription factor II-I repeat domain-containing protein 2B-like [Homarus americanus]|uniref:General transcription factor II-I repeat domain-containing protein 2B-like n=1 Tax=Homarus americanus TaxID=6706 RepID=A0A8J5N9P6_HOMAM|nr:General transcription factor II-I repeat domain-containing protein 2B-like [Homarus americanus]
MWNIKKEQKILQLSSNPFSLSPKDVELEAQLELIDLQNSDSLRAKFMEGTCSIFTGAEDQYPYLRNKAAIYACLAPHTSCEQTFSLLNLNKYKIRNRLKDENLHSVL